MKTLPVILSHLFVFFFFTLRQTALAASKKTRGFAKLSSNELTVEISQWKQGSKESTHKPRSQKNTREKMHCMWHNMIIPLILNNIDQQEAILGDIELSFQRNLCFTILTYLSVFLKLNLPIQYQN